MAENVIKDVVYPTDSYWFETRADRKLAKHWPAKGTKRAMQSANMDNMNGVITLADYGRYFDRLKTPDKIYPMLSEVDANRTHFFKTLDRDFADYLSLATHGYTSNRLLGKEMDKQLNNLIYREISHSNANYIPDADSDKVWADLAAMDSIATPAEYIKMLSAERVINDPQLMNSFKTAKELKVLGFTVPENAEPLRYTDSGEALYDLTSVYRKNTEEGKEAAPSYAIGATSEINLSSMENAFTADEVASLVGEFAKKLGIKLQAADIKPGNYTNVSISRARNYGRRIMNYIYKHTGRRPRAMPAGNIMYSQNGTPAEQAYTIAKAIGNHMVQNALLNTEKLIANSKGLNLPDAATFTKYKPVLENAASCLIAAQLVSMSGMKDEQAQILANMYKVEAAQSLARLPNIKENSWAMPLVSSYMANGVQLLAGDMRVYTAEARANFINKLGVKNTDVDLINAIMYGKRDLTKPAVKLFGGMPQMYDYPKQMYNHPKQMVNKPEQLKGTKKQKTDEEIDFSKHFKLLEEAAKPEMDFSKNFKLLEEAAKPETDFSDHFAQLNKISEAEVETKEESKDIDRKWWEIERTYNAMLSSEPKYLVTLRNAAKEFIEDAISKIRFSDKQEDEKWARDRMIGLLETYCVPGGMEKLEGDIADAEKAAEKRPVYKKRLESLKLGKEVLESTLDIVEQGLKFGSEEKVQIELNDENTTEIYGYEKNITKKLTGSDLFKELMATKVVTHKGNATVKSVLKNELKNGLKPMLKTLAGDAKVAVKDGRTA